MRRTLPSMGALIAFEASARLESFTRAAEELHLTQGAISRQIRTLETLLQAKLFKRIRQRVVLTQVGRDYLANIQEHIDKIEYATQQVIGSPYRKGWLNLGLPPTFSTRWLIPRLSDFSSKNSGVTLNLISLADEVDFEKMNMDLAIHYGDPDLPGTVAEKLMGEEVTLVCSPKLENIQKMDDLKHHTLLQHATRPLAWQHWFEETGEVDIDPLAGPRLEHFHMVIQAAISGIGVAILPKFLIEEELKNGELIMPFEKVSNSKEAYYLIYPEDKRNMQTVQVFRDWIIAELAN